MRDYSYSSSELGAAIGLVCLQKWSLVGNRGKKRWKSRRRMRWLVLADQKEGDGAWTLKYRGFPPLPFLFLFLSHLQLSIVPASHCKTSRIPVEPILPPI